VKSASHHLSQNATLRSGHYPNVSKSLKIESQSKRDQKGQDAEADRDAENAIFQPEEMCIVGKRSAVIQLHVRVAGGLASSFFPIEPCQKSAVGSPIDEWRDQKYTRKIESPMNIED
jgi:hypothetical protein